MTMTKEKALGRRQPSTAQEEKYTQINDTMIGAEVNPRVYMREIMRMLKKASPVKVKLVYHFVLGFVGEEGDQK